MVGVKSYGMTFCIFSLVLIVAGLLFDQNSIPTGINEILVSVQQKITLYHITSFVFTLIALICWIVIVDEAWVKEAAYKYAVRLIRSIDKK